MKKLPTQEEFEKIVRNNRSAFKGDDVPVKAMPAKAMSDPLKPAPEILIALGSAIIHAEEFMSDDGHPFDKEAFDSNVTTIKEWLKEMDALAFLPVKRNLEK